MAVVKYVTINFMNADGSISPTTLEHLNSLNDKANAKEVAEAVASITNHVGIKSYTLGSEQTWDYEA